MFDIIKRVVVGVSIGMSIFFLKGIVAHAEVDFSFVEEQALWNSNKSASVQISSPNTAGGFHQVANIYFDNQYTNTNGLKYAVFYGTWLFYNSGNASYTYDLRLLTVQMNALSGTGKASNCFFDGGTRLICPMTKDTTYTKLSIYLPHTFNLDSSSTGAGSRVATILNFNYTFIRFVQFGNDQLSSGEKAIVDSQKETNSILNGSDDTSATNDFDNDNVNGAHQKESDLTSGSDDTINSFNFDWSSWGNGFNILLTYMSNFVQANAKVFSFVLAMLSCGFIKLVLGR